MGASREFKKRLHREIKLYLQELSDGCPDCIALGTECSTHYKQALDVILNPAKYLDLRSKNAEHAEGSSDQSDVRPSKEG